MEKRTFLITGCAGFIGFHACRQLAIFGHTIIGIDNLDDNYSVKLKKSRLEILLANENFQFAKIDVGDFTKLSELFERQSIDSQSQRWCQSHVLPRRYPYPLQRIELACISQDVHLSLVL